MKTRIAARLLAKHDYRVAKEQSQNRQTINRVTYVEELRKEFGYSSVWSFNATADPEKPVRIERKLSLSGTPAQVRKFMAAIDKALAE